MASNFAALVESAAIAAVLAIAIGLVGFVLLYTTDALERRLGQSADDAIPRAAAHSKPSSAGMRNVSELDNR